MLTQPTPNAAQYPKSHYSGSIQQHQCNSQAVNHSRSHNSRNKQTISIIFKWRFNRISCRLLLTTIIKWRSIPRDPPVVPVVHSVEAVCDDIFTLLTSDDGKPWYHWPLTKVTQQRVTLGRIYKSGSRMTSKFFEKCFNWRWCLQSSAPLPSSWWSDRPPKEEEWPQVVNFLHLLLLVTV